MTNCLAKKLLIGALICFVTASFTIDDKSFRPNSTQHYRTAARHIEKGGIGYKHGYTTIEGFLAPDPKNTSLVPFIDARWHIFNNGKMAANAGVGIRKLTNCRAFGLNAYYDYRNTKKMHYNQVSLGLEMLGQNLDCRINGYIPVGKKISDPYQAQFAGFENHYMLIAQKYQFAMSGMNLELGGYLGNSDFWSFYLAAGPYHFRETSGPKAWGGKARLTCQFKEYLKLEFSNSYDNFFHNKFQCQLTLSMPFGGEPETETPIPTYGKCDRKNVLLSKIVQPVEKQEIIVVGCQTQNSPAIDATTDTPFYFVFVDNTSNSMGTYESPYPTLALAQANSVPSDIIYVFPGDGTTNGMNAGIILQENQKLWGSGVSHQLSTAQGNFVIPAQSTTSPQITNTTGDGITLAGSNEVSGFIISDTLYRGISGTNVNDVDISHCTVNHSEENQIHLQYYGSNAIANLNNLTVENGYLKGIVIESTATTNNCTITNCTIQDNQNDAVSASFDHQTTFDLTSNIVTGNANPCVFTFNGPANFVATKNTLNENTAVNIAPILIQAQTSPLTANISNNTISDNTCSAIHVLLNDTNTAQLTINNNTITNNGTGAIGSGYGSAIFIDPNSTTNSNCQLTLENNTLSGNVGSALYCANGDFDDFQVDANNNFINNNGVSGLAFANNSNTFRLNAYQNTITNGGDHAISTIGNSIPTANITIIGNQLTDNANYANGIALSHNGNTTNLEISNNNINNNDGSGIISYGYTGIITNLNATISNNTINNNANAGSNACGGIDIEQFANLAGSVTGNTLLGNTGAGLYVGSTDIAPTACLELSGNNSDTGYTLVGGTGTFNLAPCNIDAVNTGTITTLDTITSVQSCPDAITCPV